MVGEALFLPRSCWRQHRAGMVIGDRVEMSDLRVRNALYDRQRKRPTLTDVAKLAGVSFMTVTRTISGKDCVAEGTREKVLAAIDKVGYTPNLVARSLALGKTQTIGLLMGTLSGHFLNHAQTEQVAVAAWKRGYKLLTLSHHDRLDREEACLRELLAHQVDGLLVHPAQEGTGQMLGQLARKGLPIMTIDSHCELPIPNVTVDREHGAYLQVEHLLGLGRRRLAFLVPGVSSANWAVKARMRGYERACRDQGIDFREQIVVTDPQYQGSGLGLGLKMLDIVFDSGAEFDGLVAASDQVAFGAMLGLISAGRRIPDDVAVVGFDDEPNAQTWRPSLSTIHQPRYVGKLAMRALIAQIEAKGVNGQSRQVPRKIVLKPRLIVRESTGGRAKVSQLAAAMNNG